MIYVLNLETISRDQLYPAFEDWFRRKGLSLDAPIHVKSSEDGKTHYRQGVVGGFEINVDKTYLTPALLIYKQLEDYL